MTLQSKVSLHARWPALLGVSFLSLFVPAWAVQVELSLGPDGLNVEYTVPPTCSALPLRAAATHPVAADQRTAWQPKAGCARVDDDVLRFSDPQACASETFVVPILASVSDRRYPQAFPVGADGVVIFSDYFAPTASCGVARLSIAPPAGGFAFMDGSSSTNKTIAASLDGAGFGAYVGRSQPTLSTQGVPLVFGGAVPAWVATRVEKKFPLVMRALGLEASDRRPRLAVFAGVKTASARQQLQADVTRGGFMRFALFDFPDQATPDDEQRLWLTVAHELAHFAQPVMADHLLLEGGAEYLALAAAIKQEVVSTGFALTYLSNAINECLLLSGDRSFWHLAEEGGRAPYSCGLAVHFLLHARSKQREDGIAWLTQAYRDSVGGELWRRLFASESIWNEWRSRAVRHFVEQETASLRLEDSDSATAAESVASWDRALKRQLFGTLMRRACGGRHSFFDNDGVFVVGPLSGRCDGFREGHVVESIGGEGLRGSVSEIWSSARRSCSAKRAVTVGLADGSSLSVECDELPAQPQFIPSLRPEALQVLLGR